MLTDVTVQSVIDTALNSATERQLRISVAIVDSGGHLLGFRRTNAANLATIDLALAKARTAVFFQAPTQYLTQVMQPGGPIYTAQLTSGGLVSIGGGIPITDEAGKVIGAIGISGGTVDQDQSIAAEAIGA